MHSPFWQWLEVGFRVFEAVALVYLARVSFRVNRLYLERFDRLERWVGALRRGCLGSFCLECGLQAPMHPSKGHDERCAFYCADEWREH